MVLFLTRLEQIHLALLYHINTYPTTTTSQKNDRKVVLKLTKQTFLGETEQETKQL